MQVRHLSGTDQHPGFKGANSVVVGADRPPKGRPDLVDVTPESPQPAIELGRDIAHRLGVRRQPLRTPAVPDGPQ